MDAGDPDEGAVLNADFPAAALGMLTRNERAACRLAAELSTRILGLAEERQSAAIETCMRVASLRGWSRIMGDALARDFDMGVNELSEIVTNSLVRDTLLPLARELIEGNPRLAITDLDPYLTVDLERRQIQVLITHAHKADSAQHLLDLAGIPTHGNRIGSLGPEA